MIADYVMITDYIGHNQIPIPPIAIIDHIPVIPLMAGGIAGARDAALRLLLEYCGHGAASLRIAAIRLVSSRLSSADQVLIRRDITRDK